jgi:hypothetical protein
VRHVRTSDSLKIWLSLNHYSLNFFRLGEGKQTILRGVTSLQIILGEILSRVHADFEQQISSRSLPSLFATN